MTAGAMRLVVPGALLLLGAPVGVAMGVCGLAGTAAIIGTRPALSLFGNTV